MASWEIPCKWRFQCENHGGFSIAMSDYKRVLSFKRIIQNGIQWISCLAPFRSSRVQTLYTWGIAESHVWVSNLLNAVRPIAVLRTNTECKVLQELADIKVPLSQLLGAIAMLAMLTVASQSVGAGVTDIPARESHTNSMDEIEK